VLTAQAACLEPVEPLAKLAVEPADFPIRIRGYDLDTHLARIEADPGGFPWLAADEIEGEYERPVPTFRRQEPINPAAT